MTSAPAMLPRAASARKPTGVFTRTAMPKKSRKWRLYTSNDSSRSSRISCPRPLALRRMDGTAALLVDREAPERSSPSAFQTPNASGRSFCRWTPAGTARARLSISASSWRSSWDPCRSRRRTRFISRAVRAESARSSGSAATLSRSGAISAGGSSRWPERSSGMGEVRSGMANIPQVSFSIILARLLPVYFFLGSARSKRR